MASVFASCLPKIKRPPHSQNSGSWDDEKPPPFPVFTSNFNSLYSLQTTTNTAPLSQNYPPLSPEFQYGASTLDLSAVYNSQRLFISSPGRSNSIIDSSVSSSSLESAAPVLKNSVAVPTYSPDPYTDFRQSMEDMVEACELGNAECDKGPSNCEYLHELLLCYLTLNPKPTHKFIIKAFADLVVDHMGTIPAARRQRGGRRHQDLIVV